MRWERLVFYVYLLISIADPAQRYGLHAAPLK
jgi:hypothetical protein